MVAAITGPASPYGVEWVPPFYMAQGTAGQVWPNVMRGAAGDAVSNPMATQTTTDGSLADPAVRVSQFVQAFKNNVLGSICDASSLPVMTALATKIGSVMKPPCVAAGKIQLGSQGQPECTVTNHLTASNGLTLECSVCGAGGC